MSNFILFTLLWPIFCYQDQSLSKMVNPLTIPEAPSVETILHDQVVSDQGGILRAFLLLHQELTSKDINAAVRLAIVHDAQQALEVLLDDKRASFELDTVDGYTVLHVAIAQHKLECLRIILNHHRMTLAIFKKKNADGKNALQYAQDRKSYATGDAKVVLQECIVMLKDYYETETWCCFLSSKLLSIYFFDYC